jgi:hypothetical protein
LDTQTRIIALNSLQKLTAHVLISGKGDGSEEAKEELTRLGTVLVSNQEFSFLSQAPTCTLIDEMILLISQIAFKQENPEVQLQVFPDN